MALSAKLLKQVGAPYFTPLGTAVNMLSVIYAGFSSEVQWAQRVALMGMVERQ